MHQNNEVGMIK